MFYTWMRCALVHDAALPEDVQFFEPDDDPRALMVRAGGPPGNVLLVSYAWFDELLFWAAN